MRPTSSRKALRMPLVAASSGLNSQRNDRREDRLSYLQAPRREIDGEAFSVRRGN